MADRVADRVRYTSDTLAVYLRYTCDTSILAIYLRYTCDILADRVADRVADILPIP